MSKTQKNTKFISTALFALAFFGLLFTTSNVVNAKNDKDYYEDYTDLKSSKRKDYKEDFFQLKELKRTNLAAFNKIKNDYKLYRKNKNKALKANYKEYKHYKTVEGYKDYKND